MTEKQRKIISIMLMAISVFIFLSLISYKSTDSGTHPEKVQNLLGEVGVSISYALYNFTIGYPILILPILLFVFGWLFFKDEISDRFFEIASQVSLTGIIVSMILALYVEPDFADEVHGIIGHFLISTIKQYLGVFGSVIIIVALSLINLIWAFDPKIFKGDLSFDYDFSGFTNLFAPKETDEEENEEEEEYEEELEISQTIQLEEEPQKPKPKKATPKPKPQKVAPKPKPKVVEEIQVVEEEPEVVEKITPKSEPKVESKIVEKPKKVVEKSSETDNLKIEEAFEEQEANFDETQQNTKEYVFPSVELLDSVEEGKVSLEEREEEIRERAKTLVTCLATFGIKANVVQAHPGPVITLFEVRPGPGVKIQRIMNLENDLAMAMEARGIRMIAPIPGKSAMGIEIPNVDRQMVTLKSVMNTKKFKEKKSNLRIAFGKSISGEAFFTDLAKMPHLLIAGATGTGKSVCMNVILLSILYQSHPDEVKLILIDPKKVEFSNYRPIKGQFLAQVDGVDEAIITKPENAMTALNSAVLEMERRYEILSKVGARNLEDYTSKLKKGQVGKKGLPEVTIPYLVVVIDELADLMMTSGKQIEEPIIRLAQMARAVGIHLIIATQRPSVNVITGLIKANFPTRVAFRVASKIDARTIMDAHGGAESLLGMGDMLLLKPDLPKPERLQCAFVSTEEAERAINHISLQGNFPTLTLPSSVSGGVSGDEDGFTITREGRDPLFDEACKLVASAEKVSISFVQRRLKIGFNRAATIWEQLEQNGFVGVAADGKTKISLITPEDLNDLNSDD